MVRAVPVEVSSLISYTLNNENLVCVLLGEAPFANLGIPHSGWSVPADLILPCLNGK